MAEKKYLDLAGLQSYNELLLTGKLNDVVTYGTVEPTEGNPYKAFRRVSFSKDDNNKIVKSAVDVVTIDTLKTDLGIGTAGVTAVVTDDAANSFGKVKVTTDGTTVAVPVSGLPIESGTAGSKTSTATESQIVLGSDTNLAKAKTAVQSFTGITASVTNGVADVTAVPAEIITTGALADGMTATTQSVNDNSTKIATTAYVKTVIDNIPAPMIFKGSAGTGGTYVPDDAATGDKLPAAATANTGWTVKVITDGTYANIAAEEGDTLVSDGTTWVLIPSGNEPDGTVTNIATGTGLTGGPITTIGTISLVPATSAALGGVIVGDNIKVVTTDGATKGTISVATASAGNVGVATVAADADGGLNIDSNGVISVNRIPETGETGSIASLFA